MHKERNQLLAELYEQYHDSVFRLCYQMVGYRTSLIPLVEDCVQDAFVKALEHYPEYSHYQNPMGWIAEAAKKRLMSERRKQVFRENPVHLERLVAEGKYPEATLLTDVERWFNHEEAVETLQKLVRLLTEREQYVYEAYFVNGYSLAETAEITGLTDNAVRSAVSRIRKRAKQILHLSLILILMGAILSVRAPYR